MTTSTTAIVDAGVESVEQRDGAWHVPDIEALAAIPSLNLISVPALLTLSGDDYRDVLASAAEVARERRAFLLVDPPEDATTAGEIAKQSRELRSIVDANGALYWPSLVDSSGTTLPPSVAVSRVMARTDAERGVWKAPAGIEAVIEGMTPAVPVDETTNGTLNDLSVNVIRQMPRYGTVIWGARTLAHNPDLRYVNVRRTLLFVEASLDEGLQWVVFERNGPPLWGAIRRSVETFLLGLWREGAFVGAKAEAAFFVRCDEGTMTQDDIDHGRVNVVIGVAPLHPAEFVVISIRQLLAAP